MDYGSYSIKRVKPIGAPSNQTKKLNDKKMLMPCEVEEMYNSRYKRTNSLTKSYNTAERVFSEYVLKDKKELKTLTPNKSSSNFYPNAKDNLGELLEYKYGPRFRNDVKLNFN